VLAGHAQRLGDLVDADLAGREQRDRAGNQRARRLGAGAVRAEPGDPSGDPRVRDRRARELRQERAHRPGHRLDDPAREAAGDAELRCS
jgi:hypothetical protein